MRDGRCGGSRFRRAIAILALGVGVGAPSVHAAPVYDAAAAFSLTSNPIGVWSYGFETSLGSSFHLYDTPNAASFGTPGFETWTYPPIDPGANFTPSVAHNGTSSDLTFGTLTLPPEGLAFHPGSQGELSVIRWTAPLAGAYEISSAFRGDDFVGPTSTDVFVMHNDSLLFTSGVYAYGPGPSFTTAFFAQTGDRIDFLVGVGSDGSYYNDMTGVDAVITPVPEPTTLTLTSLGLLGLGWLARRSVRRVLCITPRCGSAPGTPRGSARRARPA